MVIRHEDAEVQTFTANEAKTRFGELIDRVQREPIQVTRPAPAQIVDCLLQKATLVFSQETFEELQTRLWRPKFDRYLDMERRHLLLHDFAAAAQWVDLPEPPRISLLSLGSFFFKAASAKYR